MKKLQSIQTNLLILIIFFLLNTFTSVAQKAGVPSAVTLLQAFGEHDKKSFSSPERVFYPETWFHFIGGNVSHAGITADLEAIASAGLSGVQLFHGQFGGPWPGVEPQIACLSPLWEDAVKHTAEECKRLGLRFSMQNCPGWAMSGGPWIEPSNAMRHLSWSRMDIEASNNLQTTLPIPSNAHESWRDYKDIMVLAFPTPLDDTGTPLSPSVITGSSEHNWKEYLAGTANGAMTLEASSQENPHWIEVEFEDEVKVRTVEFPSINSLSHGWCFEPGVTLTVQALKADGSTIPIVQAELPQANWQDDFPISIACPEVSGVKKYRMEIVNKHPIALRSLRLFSAAKKNNWESEAGWTLRSIERTGSNPIQSKDAFLSKNQIYDITDSMDEQGYLDWKAPQKGKWTILRIGHVNTGMKNGPAPPEGTGWECDKLSESGPDVQFANYIGRLSEGPLQNGLLNGMLLDSWECKTQTWTNNMESEFLRVTGYPLRQWLPAVFGYVINDHETTARFLLDWRSTIGDLFAHKFYGRMAEKAKQKGLTITYETAAGDVFPADIMEYFKFADIPMCEFWHPLSDNFVGSLNFKPIKPTASAARLYGKPRVAAEAFTSFNLTWDERWSMLKEVANWNMTEGVSHFVFHTYTHNPQIDFLPPGTSFGSSIGTPFLRGQTWWKHMPEFTSYLARCTYMLERGRAVSDVLWYLGDEINHKPDQNASFPAGFKYDYCNPDVLLNRLTVENGLIKTPEGMSYRVLWIPEVYRMLPETLEKIYLLIKEGAIVVADAPKGIATLSGGKSLQKRFEKAVKNIWGKSPSKGVHKLGKGVIVSGIELEDALSVLNIQPDVKGDDALWMHRQIDGADWYFISTLPDKDFKGTLEFQCQGRVEWWDPVTGEVKPIPAKQLDGYTSVRFDLPVSGSGFLVFYPHEAANDIPVQQPPKIHPLTADWKLSFPSGWGMPELIEMSQLTAWKDIPMAVEGKSFSGTGTYETSFDLSELTDDAQWMLDLGQVEMIASVTLNNQPLRTLWTPPYKLDVSDVLQIGTNVLKIEVTSTWFNRLVYDAGQPEEKRKTWTINGPAKESPLRSSGLLGPVRLLKYNN